MAQYEKVLRHLKEAYYLPSLHLFWVFLKTDACLFFPTQHLCPRTFVTHVSGLYTTGGDSSVPTASRSFR